jgi:hypothetical protein
MEVLKKNYKSILIMWGMFMVEISAIIRANVLYDDDLGRNLEGYTGNAYDSRYISDWVSRLLNGNRHITDISPLTQILACLLLAVSVVIVFRIFDEAKKINFLTYMCGTLVISPYFLENISYKVDSVFMALSVLAVIVPFLWLEENWKFIVASVLGLLVMCMTYQASSGIYPMLVIVVAFWKWNQGNNTLKESLIFIAKSAITYILSLAFFAVFLVKPIEEGYINNGITFGNDIIKVVVQNYIRMYMTIVSDFMKLWNILTVLIAFAFVIVSVLSAHGKKVHACIGAALTGILLLITAFGVYPFLDGTLVEPRSMYGFSVLLFLVSAIIVDNAQGLIGKVLKMPVFIIAWCFFAFSFTYGNALASQMEYVNFRTAEVIDDLTELDFFLQDGEKKILIKGSVGFAPSVRNLPYDYVLIHKLVPCYLEEGVNDWNSYRFYNYYGLSNVKRVYDFEDENGFELCHESSYHRILSKDNEIIIELKDEVKE